MPDLDLRVLLIGLAAMPLLGSLALLAFVLARRESTDDRWRGVHRPRAPKYVPGHGPGRGMWRAPLVDKLDEGTVGIDPARLLEETTEAWLAPEPHAHKPYRDGVRLRCDTCRLDLPRPDNQPEIGRHGFASW